MAKERFLRSLKNYHGPRGVRLSAEGDGETMTLSLYGVCGRRADFFGGDYDAESVAAKLAECGGKALTLRINSPGGDAFEGLAIHNLLLDYAGDVTVKVDGLAASAASIVAMAGDKVCMGAGAQLMIHCAWSFAAGDSTELRKLADDLEKMDRSLAKLYAKRMGASDDDVMALMRAETYFTADEAVAAKLADESSEPTAAEGDDETPAESEDEPPASEREPPAAAEGEDEPPAAAESDDEPPAAAESDDEDVKALLRSLGAPTARAALAIVQASAERKGAERAERRAAERAALIEANKHRMTPRTLATIKALPTLAEVKAVIATLPKALPKSAPKVAAPPVEGEILTDAEIYYARKMGNDLDKLRAEKRRMMANGQITR